MNTKQKCNRLEMREIAFCSDDITMAWTGAACFEARSQNCAKREACAFAHVKPSVALELVLRTCDWVGEVLDSPGFTPSGGEERCNEACIVCGINDEVTGIWNFCPLVFEFRLLRSCHNCSMLRTGKKDESSCGEERTNNVFPGVSERSVHSWAPCFLPDPTRRL